MTRGVSRILIVSLAAVLLLVGAAIYFLADPSQSALFPRCLFLQLTGCKCPGCGSQRVLHSLLHGDIAAAWSHNALLTAAIPVVLAYVAAAIGRPRWPRFYAKLNSVPAIITVAAVILSWWLLRNIFGW